MKKMVFFLLATIVMAVSCGKQDTVYKEFVKPGGYIYPAKPLNLTTVSGYERVFLTWEAPMDPSIRRTTLFWDNYTDSLQFSYSDYVNGVLQTVVDHLDDRSYTFDVVNYDANGNRSLAAEITAVPFGESWLASHSERIVKFAGMEGEDAAITMGRSTDEMVATKFRYRTVDGQTVESEIMLPSENTILLPRAMKGKKFEYKSAFLPANGQDTVWNLSWIKSPDPILYPLPTSDWTVTVTTDQEYGNFTCDKIFDGVSATNNRWHSARSGPTRVFPKILSIDTKAAEGSEYTLASFAFYQSPSNSTYRYIRNISIYIGNTPYDPDDTDAAVNYGTPALSQQLGRNDEVTTVSPRPLVAGRYFAIMFENSYNTSGYIDLWELVPYGFIASEAD